MMLWSPYLFCLQCLAMYCVSCTTAVVQPSSIFHVCLFTYDGHLDQVELMCLGSQCSVRIPLELKYYVQGS